METVICEKETGPRRLTPGRAIREMCVDCVGKPSLVKDCQGDTLVDRVCLFFRYRMGKGRPSVRTIRKHCLWCMGGSSKLVQDCSTRTCPLFSYRLGKNPAMAGRRIDRGFKKATPRAVFLSGSRQNSAAMV